MPCEALCPQTIISYVLMTARKKNYNTVHIIWYSTTCDAWIYVHVHCVDEVGLLKQQPRQVQLC